MTRAKKKWIRKRQMQKAKLQAWWEENKDKKLYDDNNFIVYAKEVKKC